MNKPIHDYQSTITNIDSDVTALLSSVRHELTRAEALGGAEIRDPMGEWVPLDWGLDGNGDSFKRALKSLLEAIEQIDGVASRKQGGLEKCLSIMAANLLALRERIPGSYLAYSRNSNGYNAQYVPAGISYRSMIRVVKGLVGAGFAEHINGYRTRRYKPSSPDDWWIGYSSRIRATEALVHHFRSFETGAEAVGRTSYRPEPIILRNGKKREIGYEDTDQIKAMRGLVEKYNQALEVAEIGLTPEGEELLRTRQREHGERLNLSLNNRWVHRVFNNGSFRKGGRFYGGWWQEAGKEVRRHILIDDDVTVELDYSAQFAHLLYSLEKIDYAEAHGPEDDPYTVPGLEALPRDFLKGVFLRLLNNSSKGRAGLSVRKLRREEFPEAEAAEEIPCQTIFSAIEAKHHPIARHFYTGIGLKLMNLDSQITEEIIQRCLDENITVLTIHDSFIVGHEHKDFLERTMRESWVAMGHCSMPKIK